MPDLTNSSEPPEETEPPSGRSGLPELLLRALEGAGDLFAVTDHDGRLRYANPEFERVLGWAPEEWDDASLVGLLVGTHASGPQEDFRSAVQHGRRHRAQLRVRRKGASAMVLGIDVTPFSGEDGSGCVVALRDPTEELALRADLQQRQRLELLGHLAGGVAHDFNNLLTAVTGFAQLLSRTTAPSSEAHRYAGEIERTAQRATQLTGQLLAFSSRQVIRPQPVLLNDAIADFRATISRLLTTDIELATELSPAVRAVRVDPMQLEQIVMNLVVNARDAMPEGGRLVLRTRNSDGEEERRARAVGDPEGPFSVITVEDAGTGIDPELLPRIFDPFFTTKQQGTGLGLGTVYGIVKQSGGFVRVLSESGVGSRFEVFLPRIHEEPAPPSADSSRTQSLPGHGTILVVEDESSVRALCCEVLKLTGYGVLAAADGEEALALAGRHEGPIDLLLTDVMMPGLNGPDLAVAFAELRPGVPVIYMSGYVTGEIQLSERLGKDSHFLPKPLDIDELGRTVEAVLGKSRA